MHTLLHLLTEATSLTVRRFSHKIKRISEIQDDKEPESAKTPQSTTSKHTQRTKVNYHWSRMTRSQ